MGDQGVLMKAVLQFTKNQWICAALLFCFFMVLNSGFFWKQMYPIQYEAEVVKAARKYQVDPFLILAVMKIESDFKPNRSSSKGASGLMQLMPETAQWIKERSGLNQSDINQNDPQTNIMMGTWYLAFLLEKYKGEQVKALAAYNAGQGNVDRWIETDVWDGQARTISNIPYGETRHYVKRALLYYEQYKAIYGDHFKLD